MARNTLAAEAKQSLSFLFKHLSKYVAVLWLLCVLIGSAQVATIFYLVLLTPWAAASTLSWLCTLGLFLGLCYLLFVLAHPTECSVGKLFVAVLIVSVTFFWIYRLFGLWVAFSSLPVFVTELERKEEPVVKSQTPSTPSPTGFRAQQPKPYVAPLQRVRTPFFDKVALDEQVRQDFEFKNLYLIWAADGAKARAQKHSANAKAARRTDYPKYVFELSKAHEERYRAACCWLDVVDNIKKAGVNSFVEAEQRLRFRQALKTFKKASDKYERAKRGSS